MLIPQDEEEALLMGLGARKMQQELLQREQQQQERQEQQSEEGQGDRGGGGEDEAKLLRDLFEGSSK